MSIAEILQYPSFVRAIIASCSVGLLCGMLGPFIVLRNMSLIGDALSHAILPGVVVAFMLVGYSPVAFFAGAVLAGLGCAMLITWIQRHLPTKNDAAIGIIYTVMFALGVMGISKLSRDHGAHLDLSDFLFGNVLGVSDQDLWITGIIMLVVLLSVLVLYRPLFISTFQPTMAQAMGIRTGILHYFIMVLLAFAVVASLQTVGVILVVALLIAPTSAALLVVKRLHHVLIMSAVIGLLSSVLGMYGAIQLETTPGPAMAVVAGIVFALAALFSPRHGFVTKHIRQVRLRRRILGEDILKSVHRHGGQSGLSTADIVSRLGYGRSAILSAVNRLRRSGMVVSQSEGQVLLTRDGQEQAIRLVRAHRLWETYLVNQMGMSSDQIHDEAERFEHFMDEDFLTQVDQELGHPAVDPHGSPIPHDRD